MKIYMNHMTNKNFISDNDNRSFNIPFIEAPEIELDNKEKYPVLLHSSEELLENHYKNLQSSELRTNGAGIIFGTFDNLHIGHKSMINTAKHLCSQLYIGIEDKEVALKRKNNKHPIQANRVRIEQLIQQGIPADHIFVRRNATFDIRRLNLKGVNISMLFVGESQKDNPEIVDAVDYFSNHNIAITAIGRLKTKDNSREISSTSINKLIQERKTR